MADVARDFVAVLVVGLLIAALGRNALWLRQRIVLGFALVLPLIFAIEYRGRSGEGAGLFGIAVGATVIMVVAYGYALLRLFKGAPNSSSALAGVSVRWLSVLYLVSTVLWFAGLYWTGSASDAHQVVFSTFGCPETEGVVKCGDSLRQLSYPESLFVAFGTFLTVGHSGITAASSDTRLVLLMEFLVVLPGAIIAIRGGEQIDHQVHEEGQQAE